MLSFVIICLKKIDYIIQFKSFFFFILISFFQEYKTDYSSILSTLHV